jgi:flagellar biosynthesis/type III secretory pathway chaperone
VLMGPEQFASNLRRLFAEQDRNARELLAALRAEREALAMAEATRLEAMATTKAPLINRLEQLANEQRHLLASLGMGEDPAEAMERALGWCDSSGELRHAHEAAMQQVIECQQQNQQNGVMVRHQLGHVRRALQVLHNAHTDTMLYGPDGRTETAGSSRLLAEG